MFRNFVIAWFLLSFISLLLFMLFLLLVGPFLTPGCKGLLLCQNPLLPTHPMANQPCTPFDLGVALYHFSLLFI